MSLKAQMQRIDCIDRLLKQGRYPNAGDFIAAIERETGMKPSPKTIGRDIELMKQRGAPIRYDNARHGYYYAQHNWSIPAMVLTEGELLGVLVVERALVAYQNSPFHGIVTRLFDRLIQHLPEEVSVKTDDLAAGVTVISDPVTTIRRGIWPAIRAGIRAHRSIALHYRAPGYDEAVIRIVDPLHVVGHRGEWYLLCYSHHHEAIRVYALARIEKVTRKTSKPFTPPEGFRIDDYIDSAFGIFINEDAVDIAIRFSGNAATIMRERTWHPTQQTEPHEDGSVTVRFRTNQQSQVLFWVSQYGPNAEILEPAELRERAAEWFREAAGVYRAGDE